MAGKLLGSAIQSGSITTTQISSALSTSIQAGGGPKITSITYPGDDLAANTGGGDSIVIRGSGFGANVQVYINNIAVSSLVRNNTNAVTITTAAQPAGTYPIYLINTDDGGTAILVPGIQYSGTPTWVSTSPLAEQTTDTWNISLSATGDSPIVYSLQEGSSLPDGITLATNGLISGTMTSAPAESTTYNFTVVATDPELQDTPKAFSVTVTITDPYFYLTTLLLSGDGANNQTNHTFLDSSNNNFTITRNGNASQGTFSPFSQTGWSNYFDGSGDYLSFPGSSAFNITTNTTPFTIEFWSYPIAAGGVVFSEIFTPVSDQVVPIAIIMAPSSGSVETTGRYITFGGYSGSAWTVAASSNTQLNLNTWTHVACVFTGSTTKIFFNGVDVTAANPSATWPVTGQNGNTWYIAKRWDETATAYCTGYISNFRFVKGTAVYTSAFTPPTAPLTAIANTSLLTCQSNRFIDNSTNNFAITRFGDTSVQAFSPFAPTAEHSAANVGGSGYFDGTGDNLVTSANTAFTFGTGDLTLECWIYQTVTSTSAYKVIFADNLYGLAGGWTLYSYNNALNLWKGGASVATEVIAPAGTIRLNSWNHVSWTRSGSSNRLYINGTQVGNTTTDSTNYTANTVYIGSSKLNELNFPGYISDARVLKGTALYTSNFTPPTTPLTNIANTSLLLNFTNAGITDATAKNVLETVGDAKISTVQSKFGGSSMFFDGNGDFLKGSRPSIIHDIAGGDFTIEFWVYFNSIASDIALVSKYGNSAESAGNLGYVLQWVQSSSVLRLVLGTGSNQSLYTWSWAPSTGIWYHVAVTRSGTAGKAFIDGTQIGTTSTLITNDVVSPNPVQIGKTHTVSEFLNGYIDDLRITKGYARYTANFTPPINALKLR